MKKILALVVIMLLSVVAYGCQGETTTGITTIPDSQVTSSNTTESTTSTTQGTTTTTTTVSTTTTTAIPTENFSLSVPFTNYSTEYSADDPVDQITFYYFADKYGIPYVDIEEFVTMLLGIIDDSIIVEVDGNTVKVSLTYYYTEEEKTEYGITEDYFEAYVTFDFDTTVVSAPNIDALDYFSGETDTDFSEGLNVVSYTEEEEPPLTIDLADYHFCFYTVADGDDTIYAIPVSIADLFLTGSMFDVVANGYNLYGFDAYQLGEDAEYPGILVENDMITSALTYESRNFLEMAFDYFYGLKDYKGIDNFHDYMSTYFSVPKSFSYKLATFVDSFEDLHTGVITYGQSDPTYDYYDDFGYPDYILEYAYQYYGTPSCLDAATIDWESYEDMAYINITEFSSDFKEKLDTVMAEVTAFDPDYVVLDLSANGGGVIAGVLQLLNYMTNDDVTIYTTIMGARSSTTYSMDGDKALDAKFYIVTSGATFSAANLTVSIAKEMDIATIIGSNSGGGACAVKVIVLPNGAILQMSSNMNLTDSEYNTIEEGIGVEYIINFRSAGIRYWSRNIPPTEPTVADYYGIVQELESGE